MLVNNIAVPRLSRARVDAIAELIEARTPLDHWPAELFHVEDNVRRAGPLLQAPITPGRALDAGDRPRPPGPDRRNEALQLARAWRRGFRRRAQMGSRPQRARRRTLHRWQRRRRRTRHVQGSRAADFACRPHFRGNGDRRLMRSARPAVSSILRGEYEYLKPRLDAELERMRLVRRLGPGIRGCAAFRLRYRDPRRRRRLCLRRRDGVARIARGQAGTTARSSAVSGYPRLSRPADGDPQRRNALPGDRGRHPGRRGVRAAGHQEFDRLEDALRLWRLRVAGRVRVFLSASPSRRCSKTPGPRATSRRCRSAVLPAC